MTLKKQMKVIMDALEEMKAISICNLDVRKMTSFTDRMIIASGTSNRHVKSIAGKIIEQSKKNELTLLGSEGIEEGEWALIDLGDVIVHIMQPAIRDYYQLERLWSTETQKITSSS